MTGRPASGPFHVLAKPAGAACNLDCRYCYFLSTQSLYPGPGQRMTPDVLEAYVAQMLSARSAGDVELAWQGGEPTLMGLEFFRRAVATARRLAPPGVEVRHTLQTNGTLLDDEWAAFLRDQDVLVGLSLDGPAPMHDAYRVDRRGRPTFARVLGAVRLLQRHQVAFNIMCAVHAANADHPLEVYRFLRDDVGARFIQFIPVVERAAPETPARASRGWKTAAERRVDRPDGRAVTDRTVAPDAWGRFLIGVFDAWLQRDVGTVFVQMFDSALAAWVGLGPSLCVFRETCGDAVALEHNGDCYSCDHFVETGHRLGNILETPLAELVDSPAQRRFGAAKRDGLPAHCRRCEVRFACNGECPRNRFANAPDGEPGLNYLCPGYHAFFTHIARPMSMMAGLLRRGRYADGVMDVLAAEAAGRYTQTQTTEELQHVTS